MNPISSIPALSGKIILVTGANKGIGLSTVKHLARKGAKVYLGARNENRATDAISQLQKDGISPGTVEWLPCDLSTPEAAKAAGEKFLEKENRLDILVNNAAVMADFRDKEKPGKKSDDGIPEMLMVNHIGHFQLTKTLLPLLIKTSEEPNSDVRIVVVASDSHDSSSAKDPAIQFKTIEDLKKDYATVKMPMLARYCVSKLANVLFMKQLQRRLSAESHNITCLAIDPGTVNTFGHLLPYPWISKILLRFLAKTPDEGAWNSCFAAGSPDIKEHSEKYKGAFLMPVGKITPPSANAQKEELGEDLWKTTEDYLNSLGL
ncbi:hypothetical protein BDQ12DRAFT_712384 [Crucibulum laeve]|uniref:NAD(P)-binding protein n=1 Tax=Crucibulum laeve TaxID=68775 RepID=A0A5C3M3E2_9AGAR|nr:hypothetical protein BDQ12DRAFT_712384 [Crucibulum laeve]